MSHNRRNPFNVNYMTQTLLHKYNSNIFPLQGKYIVKINAMSTRIVVQ